MRSDLVLEGGGAKAAALTGAVAGLHSSGVEVARVAGTSAGAAGAALLAAGMPPEELDRRVRALELGELAPPGPLEGIERIGTGPGGLTTILQLGLHDHEPLLTWLRSQLHELGVDTFGDLRSDDPDDGRPPERRYQLVLAATDLTRGRQVLLPWGYRDYGLDPDEQLVVDAVAAAAAVPLVFEPVRLPLPGHEDPALLVDGGCLTNLAVDLFDRTDDRPSRWPTIGVKLTAGRSSAAGTADADGGAIGHLRVLMAAMVAGWDQRHLADPEVLDRTLLVDTTDVPALALDLDEVARRELSERGHRAAERWITERGLLAS